jgi:hypothetical protein
MAVPTQTHPTHPSYTPYLFFLFLMLGFLIFIQFLCNLQKLNKITRESLLLKKYNTVRILVSSQTSAPFSFWFPFRSCVVLPEIMILDTEKRHLAIAHEIQHHRQGDTKFLHIISLLKILCFWNPFIYLLERKLSQIQEFACDEALCGHRGFSSLAYCRCLLWVAEQSRQQPSPLLGTLSMAKGSANSLLKRRIEIMLKPQAISIHRSFRITIGILAMMGMFAIALTANANITNPSLTLEQAQTLFETTESQTDFPIPINIKVLEQLNHYLGTPEGRKEINESLAQMENHKKIVFNAIEHHHVPTELAAIPIVESHYVNSPQNKKPPYSAGIWQFIPDTANNFGLTVNATIDLRIHVEKETDAAMRLLKALNLQFQDWGLALLAYNAGAERVQTGIQDTNSRDVWTLISKGYEGDPSYIPKVMAAALILRNPTTLD